MASYSLNKVQFPPDEDPVLWLFKAYGRPQGFWEKQFDDGSGCCFGLFSIYDNERGYLELPFTEHAFDAFMAGIQGQSFPSSSHEPGYCSSCYIHGLELRESQLLYKKETNAVHQTAPSHPQQTSD